MSDHVPRATWNYPTSIRLGMGRIKELPAACGDLGMSRPLLVTDPGVALLPMTTSVVECCRTAGLELTVFSDVQHDPAGETIETGVEVFNRGVHDGVIALGGGSAMDAAKAIAFMSIQERSIWEFEDAGEHWRRAHVDGLPPVVAVPTTAGTGSEVGRCSVITDTARRTKRVIFHPLMMPGIAILDPELTLTLPARLTAATGMDALSHNLEAYCAMSYHPMAQGIAVEGMRLIEGSLATAVSDGKNLEARSMMLVASCMGATAFQRGLGAVHALANPLGAMYHKHHGELIAVLMPYVLSANRRAVEPQIEHLALAMGLPPSFDDFLAWLLDLRAGIGMPSALHELGIDESGAEEIGQQAFRDPTAAGNPLPFTAEEYRVIYLSAVRGKLDGPA